MCWTFREDFEGTEQTIECSAHFTVFGRRELRGHSGVNARCGLPLCSSWDLIRIILHLCCFFCCFLLGIAGKGVFVIQSCAPPVNESIMELILCIGAAKRAGASHVTAVIPYFGYRLNRRGLPLSTTHHSRFLWNAASDLAKMLMIVGADKVISVDLQKPGQGHEACFFKTQLPAETISTHDLFAQHFQQSMSGEAPIVVVAPNTEMVKKAKKFQRKLKSFRPEWDIETATFLRTDAEPAALSQILGDLKGKDVVLIEDYIGTSAMT
jgi:ribose-phosphate pyrophosphokinase